MKKGAIVGGGPEAAEAETKAKPPRGMLPPTGNGPIEVTRETLDSPSSELPTQSTGTAAAAPETLATSTGAVAPETLATSPAAHLAQLKKLLPPEVATTLDSALPEKDADRATVISACERRLHAAGILQNEMKSRALATYFYVAGPAVRLAWATESWRATMDPSTGNACRSWSAWLRINGVSRQHAYRMTKEEPLLEALKPHGVKNLDTAQIDALTPVMNNYGDGAVRRLWAAAMGWGDTSGPSLLKLRVQLGLEPSRLISEGEEPQKTSGTDLPVLRFQSRAGTFDADQVRKAARAQPDIARLVALAILEELGEETPAG